MPYSPKRLANRINAKNATTDCHTAQATMRSIHFAEVEGSEAMQLRECA
jgi:hypothetical protein